MNLIEYYKVKDFKYLEYCDYLQRKYGIGNCSYFTTGWSKNKKVSRTNEGLIAHHKYEDHAIKLNDAFFAKRNPYEWQLGKNIVYCDLLEHIFLHILICENPSSEKNEKEVVGIGSIIEFIIPELNDLYAGYKTKCQWRKKWHDLVKQDKDVYIVLLKRFKRTCNAYPFYNDKILFRNFRKNMCHT